MFLSWKEKKYPLIELYKISSRILKSPSHCVFILISILCYSVNIRFWNKSQMSLFWLCHSLVFHNMIEDSLWIYYWWIDWFLSLPMACASFWARDWTRTTAGTCATAAATPDPWLIAPHVSFHIINFFSFSFYLLGLAPSAYGISWARSQIRDAAASRHYSHGNAGSKQQRRILNPLSKAKDWTHILMDTSWVLNLLSHNGNSWFILKVEINSPFFLHGTFIYKALKTNVLPTQTHFSLTRYKPGGSCLHQSLSTHCDCSETSTAPASLLSLHLGWISQTPCPTPSALPTPLLKIDAEAWTQEVTVSKYCWCEWLTDSLVLWDSLNQWCIVQPDPW